MIEDVLIPPGPVGGAHYLGWCAYPLAKEADARVKWASCVYALPQRAMGSGRLVPGFPKVPEKDHIETIAGRGARRIWHWRIPSLWLAEQRMSPNGAKASALYAELAARLPAEFGLGGDEREVRRKCWKESLPALAMMYPIAQLLLGGTMPDRLTPVERVHWLAYHGEQWVPGAVANAQAVIPSIAARLSPERLLRPQFMVRGVLHME